jgi:hypothetical protein
MKSYDSMAKGNTAKWKQSIPLRVDDVGVD